MTFKTSAGLALMLTWASLHTKSAPGFIFANALSRHCRSCKEQTDKPDAHSTVPLQHQVSRYSL